MKTMKTMNFDQYWNKQPISKSSMPGIFTEAMKEIARDAWKDALNEAMTIVNQESDQNKAMDKISELF